MAEPVQIYLVTSFAGDRVAGILHSGVGTTLALTDAQARYELLLGTIVPDGTTVPVEPPKGAVDALDRLEGTRGSKAWDIQVSELALYLLLAVRQEVDPQFEALLKRLLGDAGAADDTLGKLSTRIGVLAVTLREEIEGLDEALSTRLRADADQTFSAEQRTRAQRNLGLGEAAVMSRADIVAAVRSALEGKEF